MERAHEMQNESVKGVPQDWAKLMHAGCRRRCACSPLTREGLYQPARSVQTEVAK